MTARDYLLFAVTWIGLAVRGTAQTVSITFDDGPTTRSTPLMTPVERNEALIARLRERGVQAMFFVTVKTGTHQPEGLAMLRRLSESGHLIANHTVTHPDFNERPAWRRCRRRSSSVTTSSAA